MSLNLYTFLETIESDDRVKFLRVGENREFPVRYYEGVKGNLILIDMSEEDPTDITIKNYLKDLGLSDRIPDLFSDNPVVEESSFSNESSDKAIQDTKE